MDTMTENLRVVREKVDETNVRLGTMTQELESIRDAIPEPGAMMNVPVNPATSDASAVPPGTVPGSTPSAVAGSPAPPPPVSGMSPQRLFDGSYSDYTAGNYSLAVQGFETFVRSFPKNARAHEAQLYAAESLAYDKKDMEAVVAYDRVISNYAGSASVPQAYYKRGLALERLGEVARARESYETVLKQFADSQQATLAKQRLDGLSRSAR
jgi:TolA-binding protein